MSQKNNKSQEQEAPETYTVNPDDVTTFDDIEEAAQEGESQLDEANDEINKEPVSYTHLTLPTNSRV